MAYLVHVISQEGTTVDMDKILEIKDWQKPHNLRELREFLGLTGYYRKFIRGMHSLPRTLLNR